MSPIHTLADTFTPSPRHGLAFSAMPDAPVLDAAPWFATARRRIERVAAVARRTGARFSSSLPLATSSPAPVRAECTPGARA